VPPCTTARGDPGVGETVSLMFLMLGEITGSILSQIDTVLSTIMMLVVIVVLVALIAMIIGITLSALGVVFGEAGRQPALPAPAPTHTSFSPPPPVARPDLLKPEVPGSNPGRCTTHP
jgi:hypothetical protein